MAMPMAIGPARPRFFFFNAGYAEDAYRNCYYSMHNVPCSVGLHHTSKLNLLKTIFKPREEKAAKDT